MSVFLQAVVFGIVTAAILAIASMGLTLQFGVTNYVNFAYGDFMTFGAFIAWTFNRALSIPFWATVPLAAIATAGLSFVVSEYIYRPFIRKGAPLLFILIVSFGVSLMASNAILAIWGGDFKEYSVSQGTPLHFGGIPVTPTAIWIVLLAVALMLGVHFGLTRTRTGKAMRALSDDNDLARVSGIPVRALTRLTWLISGALAGVGGCVLALNTGAFDSNLGVNFLFLLFAVIILGGIGRPYGAMLGALVIGLVLELSGAVIPSQYSQDIVFGILVLVLLIRPQGLLQVAGKN